MRPAFSSINQAASFASLLLLLMSAPWLAHITFLPQREQTYSSQSIRWEKFPWVQKFIYEETNDIDIAFIGSSHLANAINTPYVQQELSERVGHETVVRSIAFASPGFDALYFFTNDLLEHRHVNTLVFYDECSGRIPYRLHQHTPLWFRFGDDGGVMSGLPFRYQALYYYAAMVGMPRNLVELFVSNLPEDPHDQLVGAFAYTHAANPETTLGCCGVHLGFDPNYRAQNTNFAAFAPRNEVTPADVCIFIPEKAASFAFSDRPLPISQIYFAKQFGFLTKIHGCNLVALHMPLFDERTSPVMHEARNWPDLMKTDICLMGISEGRLLSGLSESEIRQLYSDPGHLNLNGQKYFTHLLTPALIQFYESHSHH